jgi:hypothetical protein
MDLEVGDRVRFKTAGLPELEHHVGWEPMPAIAESGQPEQVPLLKTWQEHFGGLVAMVDVVDPVNQQVRVRGKDRDGNDFTVLTDAGHFEVVRKWSDFSGEAS